MKVTSTHSHTGQVKCLPNIRRSLLRITSLALICALTSHAFAANAPTAQNLSLDVAARFNNPIVLQGSSQTKDPLTFKIVSVPVHGTLSGTPPNVTYTPQASLDEFSYYLGPDNFQYVVSDSKGTSTPATVSLVVKPGIVIQDVKITEGNSGDRDVGILVSVTTHFVTPWSVDFAFIDGTATAGLDYRVPFGPSLATTGVSVAIPFRLIGDTVFELDETCLVQLSNPSANVVIARGTGRCTILNDDPLPLNGNVNVVCCATIGTAALTPENSVVEVGQPITLSLAWTHPVGWRQLDSVDLLIFRDEGTVLRARWHQTANAFSLLNSAADKFLQTAEAGSPARLETPAVALHLPESSGDGLPGQVVTINYSLSFKPQAAGRTFSVEAFATDDEGNQQGFESVGTVTVLPR